MERYDYYALGERLQNIIQFAVDVQALCEYADVKDGLGKKVFDQAAHAVDRQLNDWFNDDVDPRHDQIGVYPAGLKAVVAERLPLGTARMGKCVGPCWVGVAEHALHRAMLIIEDAKLGPLNYYDFGTGMANGAPIYLASHKDAWLGFDRHQLIAELTIELAAAEARETDVGEAKADRSVDSDSIEEVHSSDSSKRPSWNADLKILTTPCGNTRPYFGQAKNCHVVLSEFQRSDWPTRIDDPLPYKPAVNPCKRVEETCKTLNTDLTGMRFRVADGGKSFLWEKIENSG
jgi:hypothetical protein